jgi:hypothetical protein
MSYLFIKQSDTKIFKAFLSGAEIEVGVVVQPQTDVFGTGEEIEIFYGENSDTYKARVTRQKKTARSVEGEERHFLMLGLLKN